MLIIGCDYIRASSKLRLWIRKAENWASVDSFIAKKLNNSTANSENKAARCEWGWRLVDTRWFERLLSELQFELWVGNAAEFAPNGLGNRRPIDKMRNCCCG